jgi:hypothetical protein
MIDLDQKMVLFKSGNPPQRILTDLAQKVIAWSKKLPQTNGKRQQAAVASGFIYKFGDLEVPDFMSTQDYNHVMQGNGPPRYDIFTGKYYDYGAADNNDPSAIVICTDDDLLVEKGSKDGEVDRNN